MDLSSSSSEDKIEVKVGSNAPNNVVTPTLPEPSPKEVATPSLTTNTSGLPRVPQMPALGVPITPPKVSKNKPKMLLIAVAVLVFVIALGAIFGVYKWQHDKVVSLTQSVQAADAKAVPLEKQIQTLNNSLISAEPNVANNKNLFRLPSLGIELTIPDELADITSSSNSNGTVVNMSTQALTQLDPGCTASFGNGKALGDFSIVTGDFKNTANSILIKQFPNYFIAYTAPPATCSSVATVNALDATLVTALKESFSTIQTIAK